MGCHAGTRVTNATELKKATPGTENRAVMIHPNGKQNPEGRMIVYCDIETDPEIGWHLAFMAFPRIRSPYVTAAYDTNNRIKGGSIPLPTDTDMKKFSDDDIRLLLNTGIRQTRAV
jgi:hypothetical protein